MLPGAQGNENCYGRIITCENKRSIIGHNTNVIAATSANELRAKNIANERRFIMCKTDVKKGTELLWFYGPDYWQAHDL